MTAGKFKILGQKQKLYLLAILDLYDKRIVSYVISHSINNRLVFATFNKVIKLNQDAKPIFYGDR